jgi:rare lipoprotein A
MEMFFVVALAQLMSPANSGLTPLVPPANQPVIMTVSWYNCGTKTANGEKFRPGGRTAAHPYLKFGTRVLVFNPETSRSCVVRINDRGPFVTGRDLDLAEGAAEELGFKERGVGPMVALVLPEDHGPRADLPTMSASHKS